MFGKNPSRWLLIALLALCAIWFLSERFSTRAKQRTFRTEVVAIDTASLTRIEVRSPKTSPDALVLERRGNEWVVVANGRDLRTDRKEMAELLGEYARLKADHVLGTPGSIPEGYGMGDSAATHLIFTTGKGEVRMRVGQERYGPDGQPLTPVLREGDDQVFAVAALLLGTRDLSLTQIRPKQYVSGDPAHWQSLRFEFPGDSGYVIQRHGTAWLVDSLPCDSGKVARFLQSLAQSQCQSFADTVDVTGRTPSHRLTIIDDTRPDPVLVEVFPAGFANVITSTLNPGNVMNFDPMRELPRMFRPARTWAPDPPAAGR